VNLQFHPSKEVSDLPPPLLLLEHNAHLLEAELAHKRSHHHPHVVVAVDSLRERAHFLNRGEDVSAVQLAVAVILQVPHHLLGGPLNPPRGLSLRALVPPQDALVRRLSLYDAPRVVVGQRLLRVPTPRLGSGGVAGSRGPRVALDGAANEDGNSRFLILLVLYVWRNGVGLMRRWREK